MTSPRPRTLRAAALAVGVAVAGLALAGCSATNPITTQHDVLRRPTGSASCSATSAAATCCRSPRPRASPGRCSGRRSSTSSAEDRTVTVAIGDDTTDVELRPEGDRAARRRRRAEDGTPSVMFESVESPPGAVVTVTISTPEDGSITADVPVLDGTLPEYATRCPTPTPAED